jgi:predicted AAA+ superfamily ATPase
MNMMTEVDILLIKQIELKYLPKIKQLFYKLAVNGHKAPNISKLALDIETSRATVMNYIKYLKDARLLNLIYPVGEEFPKKPAKVILHNTNLMYAIYPFEVQKQEAMETFFINSLWKDHKVNLGSGKNPSYIVDGNYKFQIVDAQGKSKTRMSPDIYYARYNTEVGKDNQLPLWLFGFLY